MLALSLLPCPEFEKDDGLAAAETAATAADTSGEGPLFTPLGRAGGALPLGLLLSADSLPPVSMLKTTRFVGALVLAPAGLADPPRLLYFKGGDFGGLPVASLLSSAAVCGKATYMEPLAILCGDDGPLAALLPESPGERLLWIARGTSSLACCCCSAKSCLRQLLFLLVASIPRGISLELLERVPLARLGETGSEVCLCGKACIESNPSRPSCGGIPSSARSRCISRLLACLLAISALNCT
mmetsp:Transcript_18774/g.43871  ORF Transcript_18774/g.43871 Transcript_18774/m.43871 type:complete len:242 (-) Transcript_18774:1074-1799(-)